MKNNNEDEEGFNSRMNIIAQNGNTGEHYEKEDENESKKKSR